MNLKQTLYANREGERRDNLLNYVMQLHWYALRHTSSKRIFSIASVLSITPCCFFVQVQYYAFSLVIHENVKLCIYFPFVSLNRRNTSSQIAYIFHHMASTSWFVFGKWHDSFFKLNPLRRLFHMSLSIDNFCGIIFVENTVNKLVHSLLAVCKHLCFFRNKLLL